MIMQSDAIDVKVTEPVATIALRRPDRGNALTRAMIAALRESLRDLYLEKRVRAIILTGTGEPFCSGLDANELLADAQSSDPADQARIGEQASEYRDLLVDMLQLPKPIIASVNGLAAGSGAGLVLAADLAVATATAKFGLPDTRLGLVAGVVGPLLAFRLGAGPAARLMLTGEMLQAEEAHRTGIYHELVAEHLVWARAAELGKACAEGAPEAVGLTKRLLLETIGEGLPTQLTSGVIATATARTTEAAQEGLKAFLEKRPPEWK